MMSHGCPCFHLMMRRSRPHRVCASRAATITLLQFAHLVTFKPRACSSVASDATAAIALWVFSSPTNAHMI